MIASIYGLLAQINLEGFEQAAELNTLFGVLVSMVVILVGAVIFLFKKYEDKNAEFKQAKLDHIEDIKTIRKENSEKIDEIRKENTQKEEERHKHWRESEKETLIVLKGVNSVLEMSEKMKQGNTEKIIDKIKHLENMIEGLYKSIRELNNNK